LNVGITFRLQVGEAKRRLSCELIGIDDGKYLIVKMPPLHTMENVSNHLTKGTAIAVKYMYKGTMFGFQSQIIELIHNPFKLVFIEYPEEIESLDFRGNERVVCFLPANLKIAENIIEGGITDISRAGCLFVIEAPGHVDRINLLELNNEIKIGFYLPGIEGELSIDSKQRSVKKDDDGTSIGIEFVKMDSSVQTKLFGFLSKADA
jgi:c-di-GMP-binding flagellar brake protein YcgR